MYLSRFLVILLGFGFIPLSAQQFEFKLLEDGTDEPVAGAQVYVGLSKRTYYSNEFGIVKLDLPVDQQEVFIHIISDDYGGLDIKVNPAQMQQEATVIRLKRINPETSSAKKDVDDNTNDEIVTVQLDNDDGIQDQGGDTYSLLSSSRDPLINAAGFQFGQFRYRLRGLDNNWQVLGANGFQLNEIDFSASQFFILSGQNAITRNSDRTLSYRDNAEHFGSAGLSQWINIDPSALREDCSVLYSLSNRAYSHRLGFHYNKRLRNSNSLMLGANRRWAQEGNIPGTFYDAWGAYLGWNKKFSNRSEINVILVNAPVTRGKSSPNTKEVTVLAGNNLYNSYWGMQEGEKRNSRLRGTQIPLAMLNYKKQLGNSLLMNVGLMGMKGKRYDSSLDWQNARDPRPDYYQKLPSYVEDPTTQSQIAEAWKSDLSVSQVDWNSIYQANYNNYNTVLNANGIQDNTISGKNAAYILLNEHKDPREIEHFLNFDFDKNKWHGNFGYRMEFVKNHRYTELADLLGADYFLALESFVTDPSKQNLNAEIPNYVAKKGDKINFDVNMFSNQYQLFNQWIRNFRKLDLMFGASLTHSRFQREGLWANPLFDNAKGKSEVQAQTGYGLKNQWTYKLNGRNYVDLLLAIESKAPNADQIFENPKFNNNVFSYVKNSFLTQGSISYHHKNPRLKFDASLYSIQIKDQVIKKQFFLDAGADDEADPELVDGGLINAFYAGLNQKHVGVELSTEYKINASFHLTGVLSIGDYIYTSRPILYVYDQFSNAKAKEQIYLKNFFVPGTPQTAGMLGLKYNFKKFGSAALNLSYLDRNYLEVNPLRRTSRAVNDIDRNSTLFHSIIDQEKLPSAMVLDLFIFKSWIIRKHYTALSISVNNITNQKNLISGGFEQFRFDYETKDPSKFPNKYFYLQGINYLVNLTFNLCKN
ncbi:MAG TPA: hypothetical protein PK006_05855 [Saprospiraceae bacterium]|nr:hypothetical protein [Saprospiraceae bacterium]